jgi:hypothetical protein
MRFLLPLAAVAFFFLPGSSAFSDTIQDTKFVLHVKAATSAPGTECTTWSPVPPDTAWDTNPPVPCNDFVTAGDLNANYNVYLVVAETNPDGIAGISCGIAYGSGLLIGWTRCSDLEFPSGGWPGSGSGNRITWANQTNCQKTVVPPNGVQVVAGWFSVYAYSRDRIWITQNHQVPSPELVVADCNAAESQIDPTAAGWADFSAGEWGGCNTCLTDYCIEPVEGSTWGRLKTRYPRGREP